MAIISSDSELRNDKRCQSANSGGSPATCPLLAASLLAISVTGSAIAGLVDRGGKQQSDHAHAALFPDAVRGADRRQMDKATAGRRLGKVDCARNRQTFARRDIDHQGRAAFDRLLQYAGKKPAGIVAVGTGCGGSMPRRSQEDAAQTADAIAFLQVARGGGSRRHGGQLEGK